MNYPATITCKMCGVETPNPILEQTRGFVVFSTCQSCRDGLLGRFGRNLRKAQALNTNTKHESVTESRTLKRVKILLKDYLHDVSEAETDRAWLL
jgi:ribosome-binding protein aMBF1 (putative translation factor)